MKRDLTIKEADLDDLNSLHNICNQTYRYYFGDHWTGDGLTLYLEEQFGTHQLSNDLTSDSIGYFLMELNGVRIGYLKINYEATFNGFEGQSICELEKMYLLPDFKGNGIGEIALTQMINLIRHKGNDVIILGVLETNHQGIAFYEKLGFLYHSTIRLHYTHFKADLKGLNMMYLTLS